MKSLTRHTGRTSALAIAVGLCLAGVPAPATAQDATYTTPPGFEQMVADKLPSVVGIVTTMAAPEAPPRSGPRLPPGLEEFFGGPPQGAPPRGPLRGMGSGFVISEDGLVVTNNHVIEGAERIEVVFDDDRLMEAELIGTDPATDIALLRVDSDEPLEPVGWGSSEDLSIGEWVVAIGNPFGLGGTVTAGIVSARSRDINAGPYDDFIQTDAAINRGNSGGPLFDAEGDVVGVNTAIFSPSGGNVGIGFAVPSQVAQRIVDDLRDDGRVERGWLGVQIQPVSPDLAEALGLEDARGALVADTTPESPAAEAGLREGDVITAIGGTEVEDPRALTFAVADAEIGEAVPVTVVRDGELQELSVEIGLRPAPGGTAAMEEAPGAPGDPGTPALGLSVVPVSPEIRARLELPDSVEGLAVVGTEPGSPAAEAGLMQGDVIVSAGDTPITDVAALRAAAADAEEAGRPLLLRVFRQGAYGYRAIPLDEAVASQ